MPRKKTNKLLLDWTHKRFPITLLLDVHPYLDTTFTPRDIGPYGDIEYIAAKYDTLPYYNNYAKPDSLKGKSAIVYNDRLGDTLEEAVALDALSHGLRELDSTYRNKYIPTLNDAFQPLFNAWNLLEQEDKDSYVDGFVRNMLVNPDLKDKMGYWESELLEAAQDPKIHNALTEVYSYVNPTLLPEVVVTGNKREDGGLLPLDWDRLTMKEKAAYIRLGVANGFRKIDDIKSVYNEYKQGRRLYLNGGEKDTAEKLEFIYDVLPRLLREAGLNIRVSSGYRPAGAVGTAGKKSWHWRHGAVDIVPQGKTTFEDIENAIYSNPTIIKYMLANNFGLLDESGRSAESRATMRKTGATGPHFHFGRDSSPARRYAQRVGQLGQQVPPNTLERVAQFPTNEIVITPELRAKITPLEGWTKPEVVQLSVIVPQQEVALQEHLVEQPTMVAEKELPEVVVRPQPKKAYLSYNPEELLLHLNDTFTPLQMFIALLPLTATDRYNQLLQAGNPSNVLQLELENNIMRGVLFGEGDWNTLRKNIEDLNFLKNISALGGPQRPPVPRHPKTREQDPAAYDAYLDWQALYGYDETAPYREALQILYRDAKDKKNAENAAKLDKNIDAVIGYLQDLAQSTPFTGEDIEEASDLERQDRINRAAPYKNGLRAIETAIELGASGGSILGAYANYKNWTNAANATKKVIANLLQRAQAPMLLTGTLLDAYQTINAINNDNTFDAYYNGASGALGTAGYIGAKDIFRGKYPKVDRFLDTMGLILNVGDFVKFGYDNLNNKAYGGPIIQAANIYDGTTENTLLMNSWLSDSESYNSLPPTGKTTYAPNAKYALSGTHTLPEVTITGKDKSRSILGKIWDGITNTNVAYLDNPSVMTAAGQTAKISETHYPTEEERRLADNLGVIGFAGAASLAVPTVLSSLAPGSSFWMNPLTLQMMAGTAMSEGVNLGTKVLTGRDSFGQLVGDAVEDVSGWNPNSTWWGPIVTESLNPGWYRNPNNVMNAVSRAESAVNRAINNNGVAISTPYMGKALGKMTAWVPFNRPWTKGLSWMTTGKPVSEGLPIEYITSKYPGEARKLYDVGIDIAHKQGSKGLLVGDDLLSAPKSYSTYEHYYPDRVYVDDQGFWTNRNMLSNPNIRGKSVYSLEDFLKETREHSDEKIIFSGAPRYRLEKPSTTVSTTTPKDLLSDVRIPLGERDNFKLNDIRWAGSAKEDYSNSGYGLLDYLRDDKINAFLQGRPFYESDLGPLGIRREEFPADWTMTKMPFSEESKEIINNSAKPRILAQAEKDIRDVYDPTIDGPDIEKYVKDELSYIEKQLDEKINEGYELGSDALFKAHDEGKTATRTGGLQLTNDGRIVLREGENPEEFAVHEWEHRRTNSNIGGTHYGNEKRLLRKAFTKEFRELSETVPDFKGMNMDDEMVTTVSDTREALIGKTHLRKTAPELQNKMIDKSSDEKIFAAVEKANAYGSFYIQKMRELGKLTPKLAQNIREALKYVGVYAAPVGIGLGTLGTLYGAGTLYGTSNK